MITAVDACADRALEKRRLILENRAHQQNLERRWASAPASWLLPWGGWRPPTTRRSRPWGPRRPRPEGRGDRIGKIGVPDSILPRPGSLAPEEVAVIRTHPVADTIDAVTSGRPYRQARSIGAVEQELKLLAGR